MAWILGAATVLGGLAALAYFTELFRRRPTPAPTSEGSILAARAQLLRQCDAALVKLDDAIAFATREPAVNFDHTGTLTKLMQGLTDNRADAEQLGPTVVAAFFAVRDAWEPMGKRQIFSQGDSTYLVQWRALRAVLIALRDSVAKVGAAAT